MEDNRFEKNVAEEMGSFKLKPSDAVWQQVDAQLKEDRKRRRWIIFFLFTGLLLGGAGLLYVTADKNETISTVLQSSANTIKKAGEEIKQTDRNKTSTANEPPNNNQEKKSNNTKEPTATDAQVKTEVPASNIQQPVAVVSLKKTKTVAASKHASTVQVAQTKQQNKLVITQEDKAVVATVTQEKSSGIDTTPLTKPQEDLIVTTVATRDSTVKETADSVVNKSAAMPTDTVAKKKSKWQWGLQVNGGIAQIRENLLPGAKSLTAEASPVFGNNGGGVGPTSITVNQFFIKSSLQFGAGLVLRKPVKKKHSFVTGLQYQYSSYKVEQSQRVDSFYQTTGSFSTVIRTSNTANFSTHSVAVPFDFEWKIASTTNGVFRLSTGLQQWFTFASYKQGVITSPFRYNVRANGAIAEGNTTAKATTWQPVLQLAPVYEWKLRSNTTQLGLYVNYGLRQVYKTSAKDYWWQTGVRYRIYFK